MILSGLLDQEPGLTHYGGIGILEIKKQGAEEYNGVATIVPEVRGDIKFSNEVSANLGQIKSDGMISISYQPG